MKAYANGKYPMGSVLLPRDKRSALTRTVPPRFQLHPGSGLYSADLVILIPPLSQTVSATRPKLLHCWSRGHVASAGAALAFRDD